MKSKVKTILISLILLVIPLLYLSASTRAAVCSPVSGDSRATGLVTAPSAEGKFGTSDTGACVIDPKAAFVPYKIPAYEDLKSLYYDQAKLSASVTMHPSLEGDKTQADIPMTADADHLYHIKKTSSSGGNLTITNAIPGSGNQTGVVFIDGNLTINPSSNKLIFGSGNSGLVFVVKGNVYISLSTTQVDAVIISSGTIYTVSQPLGSTCTTTNPIPSGQLVINGSLISLNSSKPIQFCRSLGDNDTPAEKINHQIKYLVILRNLFSDTLQRWSEMSPDEEIPD